MAKNKLRLLTMGFFLTLPAMSGAAPAEQTPPAKGLTLVDSATMTCDPKGLDRKACEYYLVYDAQDDIVYLIRRPSRRNDRDFGAKPLNREEVRHVALQMIDLVSVFSDKKVPVQNYSASFTKKNGAFQIKVSVLFADETERLEKFIDLKISKQ